MRPLAAYRALLLPLLLLLVLSGCSPNGTVELFLLQSTDPTKNPLDNTVVRRVRIRVTGEGMSPMERIYSFVPGGTSKLIDVPVGDNRVINVEGLGSTDDSHPLSRGRTLPMRIGGGHNEIELFIGRIRTFSSGPDDGLREERFAHTVAVTGEGKVCFAGGAATADTGQPGGMAIPRELLSSIEVFDPMSAKVSPFNCGADTDTADSGDGDGSACLATPRAAAAAAVVEDGFLIMGGTDGDGLLNTVERVDTTLGTVETLGAKAVERTDATAVQVGDVTLVAGGRDVDGQALDALEVVGPKGAIRKRTLPVRRYGMAAATAGAYGFFFGGIDEAGNVSSDVILVDPSKTRQKRYPTDAEPRAFASAVTLADGRVLVVGGLKEDGMPSTDVDLYDPGRMLFCRIGDFDVEVGGRWHAAAVTLQDGRVLVTGGLVKNGQTTFTSRILDARYVQLGEDCDAPAFGLFGDESAAPMTYRRYRASVVGLGNGTVLVAGGLNEEGTPVPPMEIYVPE